MTIEVREFADAVVGLDPKIDSLRLAQMLSTAGYSYALIHQMSSEMFKYLAEQTGWWGHYIIPASEVSSLTGVPPSSSIVFFTNESDVTALVFHFSLTRD